MDAQTICGMWALGALELQAFFGSHPTFGVVWFLFFLVGNFVFLFPIARILQRLGKSGWWSLLRYVPVVNIISLWRLAYADWPRDRKA